MKIAYLLPSLQSPSGWCSHAIGFLPAIRAHVEPLLYVSAEDYSAAQRLFPGWAVRQLPTTQRYSAGSPTGMRRLLRCYRYIRAESFSDVDAVHSLEAYHTGLVGSWLARRLGKPHFLTAHGTYGVIWVQRPLDRPLYRQVLAQTRLVCPVSQATGRQMQAHFGPELSNTALRPVLNGNDFWKQVPADQVSNRQLPETPTVISIGEVKPRKGYHLSLAAFALLKARLPAARYWIIGHYQPNGYYARLQEQVQRSGVEGVTFLGAVTEQELASRYQGASLFLLAPQQDGYYFEGFGLVFLEAGAHGLPVVATRTGGVPEVVKEGETGLLVDADDAEGMAAALLRLLGDHSLNRSMGQANRAWAETLTWENTARQQFQAYQEVLPPA